MTKISMSSSVHESRPAEQHAIGRSDFFFVEDDNYDEHIELAIPFYAEMHEALVHCARPHSERFRVLDLGCGTGKTAAAFLNNLPNSKVTGIDLFEEMLKHARRRLAHFGGRVDLRQGDFRTTDLGTGYHVCASALGIHHLLQDEKRSLYKRVYEALAPAGKFLMIDWTKFASADVQRLAAESAERHVASKVAKAEIVDAWISHWREKNIPETVEDMTIWLDEAGFEDVECVMRHYGLALITATKK